MKRTMKVSGMRVLAAAVAVAACGLAIAPAGSAAPPPAAAHAPAQPVFATPDEAADALAKATQSHDGKAVLAILGPSAAKLVASGDPVSDRNAAERFATAYAASHRLTPDGPDRMTLVVGENDWPLPIPLVKTANGWHFDSREGAEQIIDRRIGENELLTIRTLLALVAAEKDYFDRVARGTGSGEYTTRVLSSPGEEDGLYWETGPGDPPSPLGPLVDEAGSEGYPTEPAAAGKQRPYHGYFFRVLTAQGPNAPGGATNYVVNGELTGGFAIVAWPAGFGASGIMTFLVDQDGVVFQKDLGPRTAEIAAAITAFDPDESWAQIDIAD